MKKQLLIRIFSFLFLFTAAYLIGTGAALWQEQMLGRQQDESSNASAPAEAVSASAEGNWGLKFHENGKRPDGNATIEELARYDAY